ncbi:unnamed protein product [Mytilus edulis]|uniref:Uncharacterized protein n=1 Tax=Mytilus edulis TaxID=6550 RepID=A0A8S3VGA0_MYTED|nr:unnamed protein product [Mytilus edulis]
MIPDRPVPIQDYRQNESSDEESVELVIIHPDADDDSNPSVTDLTSQQEEQNEVLETEASGSDGDALSQADSDIMEDWDKKLCTAAGEGNIKDVESSLQMELIWKYTSLGVIWMDTINVGGLEGHLEVVTYLISHGSQLEATEVDGQTALHLAAQNGHIDVTKCLIDQGCSPWVKSKQTNYTLPTQLPSHHTPPTQLPSNHTLPTQLPSHYTPPTQLPSHHTPPTQLRSHHTPPTQLRPIIHHNYHLIINHQHN